MTEVCHSLRFIETGAYEREESMTKWKRFALVLVGIILMILILMRSFIYTTRYVGTDSIDVHNDGAMANKSNFDIIENVDNKVTMNNTNKEEQITTEPEMSIVQVDLSHIFDEVNGCFVLYNKETTEYSIYNQTLAETRVSPYSTFKLVATLMGLRNSVVVDENSTMDYNGTIYPVDSWNQNVNLKDAFQTSCIWYFRQIIDAVGQQEVQSELNKLSYGNCDISEWSGSGLNPGDELNGFWLASSLKISPLEQVQVLQKALGEESIYSEHEVDIMKGVMLHDEVNGYSIYGKTGTNQNKEGWYVGVAEKEQHTYYFAVYIISDDATQLATGNMAREIVKKKFANEN